MSLSTIEQSFNATDATTSPYLNERLAALATIHLGRRQNGHRQHFRNVGWKERMALIRQDLAEDIEAEERTLKYRQIAKKDSQRLADLHRDLAYAWSLEIGMHMVDLLDHPSLERPERVNLPLLADGFSYEAAAQAFSHLGAIAIERGLSGGTSLGMGFEQYLASMSPETAACMARIGETAVASSLLVNAQVTPEVPTQLTIEFWHESLIGNYS